MTRPVETQSVETQSVETQSVETPPVETPPVVTPAQAQALAVTLARKAVDDGARVLLGVTGPPGAGKSTLTAALVDAVVAACGAGSVVGVPMDGFHYAQAELERLGRARRKGAPDTFDAAGFVALLRRLRDRGDDAVYAPQFHRDLEEGVAGSIAVPPSVPLVVVEGNYLLLDDGAWAGVRPLLDACWYADVDDGLRLEQLVARHVAFGRTPDAAQEWVGRNDEANARTVAAVRDRADLVVLR